VVVPVVRTQNGGAKRHGIDIAKNHSRKRFERGKKYRSRIKRHLEARIASSVARIANLNKNGALSFDQDREMDNAQNRVMVLGNLISSYS